jgi:HSP20 family molecular chaperone IbpA|tara:strand:- start:159 stop:620 length:462 start_codon:yes stop_codon:yes gene_type:complete
MSNSLTTLVHGHPRSHPSLLGRSVFDDVFGSLFNNNDSFPNLLRQSTQGYPVADIYRSEVGETVIEFALAGFSKKDLAVEVKPEKRSITVRAGTSEKEEEPNRRIARRSFEKTYVNYDNNLDLSAASADFENGLLRIVVPVRPEAKSVEVKIK